MSNFFITGAGTDIGKTLVMTALCFQLREQGKKVTALKPVVSGFSNKDQRSDPALILQSCGLDATPAMIETISPWRFSEALSPNIAAQREGKTIALDDVIKFCREHTNLKSDVVLVEGAGGVMAPLNEQHTMVDWMKQLNWPVILVTGSYLGAISHALTALETLRARDISIRAVIVSESEQSAPSLDDVVQTLKKFIPSDLPVIKIPRVESEEPWEHIVPISWVCK